MSFLKKGRLFSHDDEADEYDDYYGDYVEDYGGEPDYPEEDFAAEADPEESSFADGLPENDSYEDPFAQDDFSTIEKEFARTASESYYNEEDEYPEEDEYAEEEYSEESGYAEDEYADDADDFVDYGGNPAADGSAEEPGFDEYDSSDDYRDSDDYGDYDDSSSSDYGYPARRSSGGSKGLPVLLAGMALALAAIVFAVLTLLTGNPEPAADESAALPVTAEAPAPLETQAPTAAETQAMAASAQPVDPKGCARIDENGRLVPTGSAVVPERSSKLPAESFASTTFIGNSFVEGMSLWSELEPEYVCADGVSLDNMIGNYLYYVTVRNYDAIYLTLGLNEIGWPVDNFIKKYEKVIDYIRSDGSEKTKNATIYVTSVMPVEEIMETMKAESGSQIHLSTILEFNERLKQMCTEKGCWYLDLYSALANEKGYLPENVAADDHVHFEKTGYRIWTDYVLNHYVDKSLVEE